jgi:hypothetical protein
MVRSLKRVVPVFAAAVLLSTLGCANLLNMPAGAPSRTASQPTDIYAGETARLEQRIDQDPDSSRAKRAHLRLAKLYRHHNNYRRNYIKAHQHMQAYFRLEKNITAEDTHDWIAALREIALLSRELERQRQETAKLQQKLKKAQISGGAARHSNRALKEKERELMEKNASLEATNQDLRQTIEMLKRLDQRLEEKRRILQN